MKLTAVVMMAACILFYHDLSLAETVTLKAIVAKPASGGGYGLPKTGANPPAYPYYAPLAEEDYGLIGMPVTGARFTDNGNNTVTDNGTGLMWIKDAQAVASLSGPKMWALALSSITALNAAGYAGKNDWRMPNVLELASIVNYGNPASNAYHSGAFGAGASDTFWSGTTRADSTSSAYFVQYRSGSVSSSLKTFSNSIRPVRGPD